MTSLRARLANRYLRLTMKRKPLHLIEPAELRDYFERRRINLHPRDVAIEPVAEAGVKGEWQRPAGLSGTPPVILYMHGGAYVFGSTGLYRSMTMPMAKIAGADLFSLDYRLAPENPCPAAIEDALAAYDWLRKRVAPQRIVFGGDSAGGGLVLATLQALRDRGLPAPAGAFVYSPWTDLAATGPSVSANARSDCMFQEASIRDGGSRYAGPLDLKDPRVSPLYGDFRGLPPLLVLVSETEMLFDDARRMVEKARAAGVDVRFEPRPGLCHVWPLFYPLYPETKAALELTGSFVRERTAAAQRLAA